MKNLTEELNIILTLLEDAEFEQDWQQVKLAIVKLETIYDESERVDLGYQFDDD